MPQRSLLKNSWKWVKRWRAELVLAPCFLVSLFFPPRQQTGLEPLHWLWLAALLAVFFSALLRAKRGEGPVVSAMAAASLLLLFNAGVVYGGGVSSPLWPGYFLFLLAVSSAFYLWWQQVAFLTAIAVLEAVQALRPGKEAGGGGGPGRPCRRSPSPGGLRNPAARSLSQASPVPAGVPQGAFAAAGGS
jgi:hypothetical protein